MYKFLSCQCFISTNMTDILHVRKMIEIWAININTVTPYLANMLPELALNVAHHKNTNLEQDFGKITGNSIANIFQ